MTTTHTTSTRTRNAEASAAAADRIRLALVDRIDAHGATIDDLAVACGTTPRTLRMELRGTRGFSVADVILICDVLGIQASSLVA